MITKLKKKILLILLRHKEKKLPNIYWIDKKGNIRKDKSSTGLNAREIAFFISADEFVNRFKYYRALLQMNEEGLVNSYKTPKYRLTQQELEFELTDKGENAARKIKEEIEGIKKECHNMLEGDDWKKRLFPLLDPLMQR